MKVKRKIKASVGFDMTPMIDIVFLLIIFFMVSTTMVKTRGMKVNLPSSKMADSESRGVVVISINEKGYFVSKDGPLNDAQLERKIRAMKREKASFDTAIIKGDRKIALYKLVHAMDVAKKAGMKKISIATVRR